MVNLAYNSEFQLKPIVSQKSCTLCTKTNTIFGNLSKMSLYVFGVDICPVFIEEFKKNQYYIFKFQKNRKLILNPVLMFLILCKESFVLTTATIVKGFRTVQKSIFGPQRMPFSYSHNRILRLLLYYWVCDVLFF